MLEKHDIPIVLGVGVSLAFILITMAFYSLLQKNDPAAKPGRAGKTSNLRKIINTWIDKVNVISQLNSMSYQYHLVITKLKMTKKKNNNTLSLKLSEALVGAADLVNILQLKEHMIISEFG